MLIAFVGGWRKRLVGKGGIYGGDGRTVVPGLALVGASTSLLFLTQSTNSLAISIRTTNVLTNVEV